MAETPDANAAEVTELLPDASARPGDSAPGSAKAVLRFFANPGRG